MREKFFKFLKDYNAYDGWVKGTVKDHSTVSQFLEHTNYQSWIDGAFTWSSNWTSGVDWSALPEKWNKYCGG